MKLLLATYQNRYHEHSSDYFDVHRYVFPKSLIVES